MLNFLKKKMKSKEYQEKMAAEIARYKDKKNIHDKISIQQYWTSTYLKPLINNFGFNNIWSIYVQYIGKFANTKSHVNIVSIGAGNCEPEVNIAFFLKRKGIENFTFECLDINPSMLERGAKLAEKKGLEANFKFTLCDINDWQAEQPYDIIIALQCLHHFTELEMLFDKIYNFLSADGYFMTQDMIGRNGHMRWPETLKYVEQLWSELDEKYRYHVKFSEQQNEYVNYDYSSHGFEGIRAQDILPLLVDKFHFDLFIHWGGITDVFINKAFGPNFDANNPKDIEFMDKAHLLNYKKMLTGEVKPTQMIAAMTKQYPKNPRWLYGKNPKDCVRVPT